MSGPPYSIKIDEYKPELDPGPSSFTPIPTARKSDRACDFCRRRKTRCDGAPSLNAKCSNCKRNQCPCTYLEASRPRGPPKAYVTALEDRIERFERLFKRLRPDLDFTEILGSSIPRGSWKSDQERDSTSHNRQSSDASSKTGQSSTSQPILLPSHGAILPLKPKSEHSVSDNDSSSDEDFLEAGWPRRRLTVRGTSQRQVTSDADSPAGTGTGSGDSPTNEHIYTGTSSAGTGSHFGGFGEEGSVRFLGKSSLFPLVKATRRYMRATAGDDGFHEPGQGSEDVWSEAGKIGNPNVPRRRRRRFWTFAPWEEAWERKQAPVAPGSSPSPSTSQQKLPPIFNFPPSDLTLPLLSLYFHYTNPVFPLLHAPTFYSQFHDGLHLRDVQFAGVVWSMLAVASRRSEDRRVLWDGWGSDNPVDVSKMKDEEIEWASAGWRFFLRSLDGPSFTVTSLDPPSLFDLQFCAICSIFLRGSSVWSAAWIIVGTGLRKAMDVGAHRKKVYGPEPSLESELWKRAFWSLVLFDRLGSASLGRPCCVREEDFDLDLPLEVDDEYWVPSDPSQPAFKQPEGKPSVVAGFVCMLKVSQIMAHALRTIYCIDKSKVLLGLVSDDWQEQIVSQLNAALDEFVETVPQHLRWSSSIQDETFQNQSASIYTSYYLALILIYRPFTQGGALILEPNSDALPRPTKGFPFPANSICTNAAHSAIRIVEEQTRRGMWNIPNMIHVAHITAVVQLMNMYALQNSPRSIDLAAKAKERERYMHDVEKCIRCLEMAEPRWIMARKFLTSLKSALPEPKSNTGCTPQGSTLQMNVDVPPVQVGAALPTVPSQPWGGRSTSESTGPTSRTGDAEQALKSHANWRWFHESERFAQQRFGGLQRPDPTPLRHHVVVPSTRHDLRSSESPTPMLGSMTPGPAPGAQAAMRPVMPATAPAGINGFPSTTRSDISRRLPVHSNTPPPPSGPPIVPDQPISSISRAARASTSGQFLSVAPPQSAARDELSAGSCWNVPTSRQQQQHQRQQGTVRVPSHPYATLHQPSRQLFRQGQQSPERQYASRGRS